MKALEDIIDGKIISSKVMKGALLVPHEHEDLDLELGEDFILGYQEHDQKEITFFIKEAITFHILDDKLIVHMEE